MSVSRPVVFAAIATALSCDHQYLSIPGANTVAGSANYSYDSMYVGSGIPTATVTAGSPELSAGTSASAHVDFSTVVDFEVTTIVFLELDTLEGSMAGHWQYELSDEEIAAKAADVTIQATTEPLTEEECGGVRGCSQEDDHGLETLGVSAADDVQTSPYGVLGVSLPPLNPSAGPGICAGTTLDDCCAGAPGIQAVECAWDPDCMCPQGADEGGFYGDGYRRCICPV